MEDLYRRSFLGLAAGAVACAGCAGAGAAPCKVFCGSWWEDDGK